MEPEARQIIGLSMLVTTLVSIIFNLSVVFGGAAQQAGRKLKFYCIRQIKKSRRDILEAERQRQILLEAASKRNNYELEQAKLE